MASAEPRGGQTRPGAGRDRAEEQRRRHEREGRQVRRERHERDLAEVEEEHGRHPELGGERRARGRRDRSREEPAEPVGERRGERHHPGGGRDRELEAHRPREPRVEHEQGEHGAREDRRGRARPAHQDAHEREARHHPRPKDGRLGSGEDREERHGAEADSELRPSREAEERGRGQHRREDHRHVPARDDEEMAEAGRPEVALEGRVELGVVAQEQAEQQPGLLRRERALDRPTDDAAHRLGRPDERARRRSQPRERVESQLRRDPLVTEDAREPGVVGDAEHAVEPDPIAASCARDLLVAADPDEGPERGGTLRPLDPVNLGDRRPSVRGGGGIGLQDALDRHALRSETGEERRVEPAIVQAAPSDPQHEDAGDGEGSGRDRGAGAHTAGRDGAHHAGLRRHQASSGERSGTNVHPATQEPCAHEAREADPEEQPPDRHGSAARARGGARRRTPWR